MAHSRIHINNVSWEIFENSSDLKVLDFAVKVMKFDIENFDQHNVEAYDTYANLLYKAGRRKEAIESQERAVKMSNNDQAYIDTLEKMKKGEKTWREN
jgi:hypothetical protein